MRVAGGIIALIAGIFGILAAGATLLFGGMGAVFEAEGAETVIGLGWGGVLFSFCVIVLGAISLGVKGRLPGILLMIFSLLGVILGGTMVAIFMVLSFIGGLLVTLARRKKPEVLQVATS
jgi:hypothetical protein